MANIINRQQTFSTNGTVTASGLHNLIDTALVNSAIIKNQQEVTSIGTADLLLIAPDSVDASLAPRKVTVQNLIDDGLTSGTFTSINLTGALTYGTATGNNTVSTTATISTATISRLTSGTTTSTAANITNGTIQTLTSSTATITGGTFSGSVNSTSGTIATLNSTTGNITNLVSTVGTVATLNSTTGTVATLNSTTGTITNLSTTLAGDFTISQGTGTIGAAKVTPSNLSQPMTSGVQVASTSGTAIEFTGIPSWVKKLTVMLNGVSVTSTDLMQLQLGSTTYSTSGYNSFAWSSNTFNSSSTSGLLLQATSAGASVYYGNLIVCTLGSNTWVSSHSLGASLNNSVGGGAITLGGSLDRLRLTTVGGTQTFDAGTINIIYQG